MPCAALAAENNLKMDRNLASAVSDGKKFRIELVAAGGSFIECAHMKISHQPLMKCLHMKVFHRASACAGVLKCYDAVMLSTNLALGARP